MSARDAVERTAREAYGKLLASLVARHRDVQVCEDALADAFVSALRTWPERGVPEAPVAWLRTAARNRLLDGRRHDARTVALADELAELERRERGEGAPELDPRVGLLFACAHPAIDEGARTGLMLQVILGLDTATIGRAFLASPEAMKKRLTRAKRKLAGAGISFESPAPATYPARLPPVLAAIYAAYGRGWDPSALVDAPTRALQREAIDLAELLAAALPEEPEVGGLLALLLFCESRAAARAGDDAAGFVPLDAQDTRRWDRAAIDRAAGLLAASAGRGAPGRYQLEAAIQAAHVHRRLAGVDTRAEVCTLYAGLEALHPSLGAALGRAAALVAAGRASPALARLDALDAALVRDHQPYWVTRADALARLGRGREAGDAWRRAAALTADPKLRAWLADRARSA